MNWVPFIIAALLVLAFLFLKRAPYISAETARQHLAGGALVIDVRSPGEFNGGHVAGAINIPLGAISQLLPERVPDKGRILLVHCLSGTRSAIAARQLKGMGYAQVFNLGSLSRARSIVGIDKPR